VTCRHRALESARARRRARGVTSVEYVLLVVAVFIPSVVVATTCFVHLFGWYANFVSVVSRPLP
jgi:Flp pilus assembly pilin Flp